MEVSLQTPLPSTRAKAIATNSQYYSTGKPCKHGHVARRITINGVCTVCLRISSAKSMRERRQEESIGVDRQAPWRWVWEQAVPPHQKIVLLALATLSGKKTSCMISPSDIGIRVGISRRQALRIIAALEQVGQIHVTHRDSSTWEFNLSAHPANHHGMDRRVA